MTWLKYFSNHCLNVRGVYHFWGYSSWSIMARMGGLLDKWKQSSSNEIAASAVIRNGIWRWKGTRDRITGEIMMVGDSQLDGMYEGTDMLFLLEMMHRLFG